jgi:hypothetical protein
MPRALNGVGVSPSLGIHEVDAVVHGVMRVTIRTKILVRSPAVADDCSAGFYPVTYDSHQCVSGSVRHGNKKCFARLSFDTTEHPLPPNRVPPMIFAPTELTLVNFNCLVRTTDLDRAALHKHLHCLSAEHSPVCNSMITEEIFL